jgi:hypothetical protein
MQRLLIALSAVVLIVLGSGAAHAGSTVLFTPMLSPPTGGQLVCNATNVGKKNIAVISVSLVTDSSVTTHHCYDVPSAADHFLDHTCLLLNASPALCRVTITGGSHKSVRAVLNVVDSSGATILSVPATK